MKKQLLTFCLLIFNSIQCAPRTLRIPFIRFIPIQSTKFELESDPKVIFKCELDAKKCHDYTKKLYVEKNNPELLSTALLEEAEAMSRLAAIQATYAEAIKLYEYVAGLYQVLHMEELVEETQVKIDNELFKELSAILEGCKELEKQFQYRAAAERYEYLEDLASEYGYEEKAQQANAKSKEMYEILAQIKEKKPKAKNKKKRRVRESSKARNLTRAKQRHIPQQPSVSNLKTVKVS